VQIEKNTPANNKKKHLDQSPENTPVASYVMSIIERGLTTELENNTMLNKVVVFVIFGPKCFFDASKHSN